VTKKLIISTLLCLFVSLASVVWAASLSVTKIGTMTITGPMPSTYTYTGSMPEFVGTASPSADVIFQVNSSPTSLVADVSGGWSYLPTNLISGTNDIVISSGVESISFVLTYSATATASATQLPDVLPEAGVGTLALVGILGGSSLFLLAGKTKRYLEDKYQ
jgi:hypothetical protein